MARFSGELVEDNVAEPKRPRFQGQAVSDQEIPTATQAPKDKKATLMERGGEILKQTGVGAVGGALAPEIMTGLGLTAGAFPLTAPAAPFLLSAGQALRGQRIASTASGAIGGLLGETSGQTAETLGASPMTAEAARFVGGMVGPEPVRYVGTATGKKLAALFGAFGGPGATKARTLGDVLNIAEIDEPKLSPDQRAFIQDKLQKIRRGPADLGAQRQLGDYLVQVAERQRQEADVAAQNLERLAAQQIEQARASGAQLTQQTMQRLSALQSQLNAAADTIRSKSEARAKVLLAQAQDRANTIIQGAAQQSPQVRQIAQVEADQILNQGQQAAEKLIVESQTRVNRLRGLAERARTGGAARLQQAQPQIGDTRRISEIGQDIRDRFVSVLDRLKEQRNQTAKLNKQEAFGEAFQKESAGQNVINTKAASDAIQQINAILVNPFTKLKNVSESAVRQQLINVRKVLSGVDEDKMTGEVIKSPPSFEQLELLRRSLRDRASGLPAEGYDAISQGQARDLAEMVEKVQLEFSPSFGKFLKEYKEMSQPINKFASDLGQAITGKADYDFNEFVTDPASIGDKLFSSERGVRQLINTIGPEEAENVARTYVATKLQGATGKQMQSFLQDQKTRDWLFSFPNLQRQVTEAADRLMRAEGVASKRETLAKTLRTEMGSLPSTASVKSQAILKKAETEAKRVEEAGGREAGKIMTAAERAAAKAASEGDVAAQRAIAEGERDITAAAKSVERQTTRMEKGAEAEAARLAQEATQASGAMTKEAQALRAKADETANILTKGGTAAPIRIRELILGKDDRELDLVLEAIASKPKGREQFGDAVAQVIAERAGQSVKGAAADWRYISERLVNKGAIDQDEADRIARQLDEILVTPADMKTKMTMAQRLVRNALVGYGLPAVERGAEALVTGE